MNVPAADSREAAEDKGGEKTRPDSARRVEPWFLHLEGVSVDQTRKRMMKQEMDLVRSWGDEARSVVHDYHKHEAAVLSQDKAELMDHHKEQLLQQELHALEVDCLAAIPIPVTRQHLMAERRRRLMQKDFSHIKDVKAFNEASAKRMWNQQVDRHVKLQAHSNQSSVVLRHLGSILSEQTKRLLSESHAKRILEQQRHLQRAHQRKKAMGPGLKSGSSQQFGSSMSLQAAPGGEAGGRDSSRRRDRLTGGSDTGSSTGAGMSAGAAHEAKRKQQQQPPVKFQQRQMTLWVKPNLHCLLLNARLTVVHEDAPVEQAHRALWVTALASMPVKVMERPKNKVGHMLRVVRDMETECDTEVLAVEESALRFNILQAMTGFLVTCVLSIKSLTLSEEFTVDQFKRTLVQAPEEQRGLDTGAGELQAEEEEKSRLMEKYGLVAAPLRTRSVTVAPPTASSGSLRPSAAVNLRSHSVIVGAGRAASLASHSARPAPKRRAKADKRQSKVDRDLQAAVTRLTLTKEHLRMLLWQEGYVRSDGSVIDPTVEDSRGKSSNRSSPVSSQGGDARARSGQIHKQESNGAAAARRDLAREDGTHVDDGPPFLRKLLSLFLHRVLKQSHFYFEVHPNSVGNTWIVGYTNTRRTSSSLQPSRAPIFAIDSTRRYSRAKVGTSMGVSCTGSLWWNASEYSFFPSLRHCNVVGFVIDLIAGYISLLADGVDHGRCFGHGSGFPPDEAEAQANAIRSGTLLPCLCLRGPVVSGNGTEPATGSSGGDASGANSNTGSHIRPELSVNFGRMEFTCLPPGAVPVDAHTFTTGNADDSASPALPSDNLASVSFAQFQPQRTKRGVKHVNPVSQLRALMSFGMLQQKARLLAGNDSKRLTATSAKTKAKEVGDSKAGGKVGSGGDTQEHELAVKKLAALRSSFVGALEPEPLTSFSFFPPRAVRTEIAVDIILRCARRYLARRWRRKELEARALAAQKIQEKWRDHYGRFMGKYLGPAIRLQALYRGWATRRRAAIASSYGLDMVTATRHAVAVQRVARGMIGRKYAEAQRMMLQLQVEHVISVVMLCQRIWRARMERRRGERVGSDKAKQTAARAGAMFKVTHLLHQVRTKTQLLRMGALYAVESAENHRRARLNAIRTIHGTKQQVAAVGAAYSPGREKSRSIVR